MHLAFPRAPIHTSLYDPAGTFPQFAGVPIHASRLNRFGTLRHHHRVALPLLAPTFSAMHVDGDVVICSSSGWAHGVRTDGRKIVYCHAPARWLYQRDAYLAGSGAVARAGLRGMSPALRAWDRRAARSADVYLANSHHTRRLIRDVYGIDADVVFPPIGVDPDGHQEPVGNFEPGYFLCVARLLAYKHVDAVIEAFRDLRSERLVVVGSGPEEPKLRALACPNVEFLASVSDDELRWLYAHAQAVIAASYEDFGLTPIEAAAFGVPTIALRYGGYLDTVIEGTTGAFFDAPEPVAITHSVRGFDRGAFDARAVRAHALTFSEVNFQTRLRRIAGLDARAGWGT
jgi:glycosyltransferase involved in cell wall biosynthesis